MKILFLSQSSPLREGGVETRCREVATRLVLQGHEVHVLCAKTAPGEESEETVEGVRLIRKKVLPDWWLKRHPFPHYSTLAAANAVMMFHLWALLRKEKYDVLREDVAPVPISGLLALRRLPLRRVAMVHMLPGSWRDWIRYYGFLYGSFGHLSEWLMAKGFLKYQKLILAVRGPVGRLNSDSPESAKAEFIPNGVDLSRFGTIPRDVQAEPGQLRLLTIGRLVKTKGHRYLLEALALLKRDHPGIRCTLVGRGPLKPRLLKLAERLELRDSIDFIDRVPFERMPEFLVGFDILVMPSLFEGFNIAVLEALASGLAVAVSDIPGFRDVVGEGEARFFPPQDASRMAEALSDLISHPDKRELLGRQGKERVQAYHWARSAADEEIAYSMAR